MFFNVNLFRGMCVCVCVYVCVYICVYVCMCVDRFRNFFSLFLSKFPCSGSSGIARAPGFPFDLSRGSLFYSSRMYLIFILELLLSHQDLRPCSKVKIVQGF